MPSGQVRRNRCHVQSRSEVPNSHAAQPVQIPRAGQINTRSRTGTAIRPPDRLTYD